MGHPVVCITPGLQSELSSMYLIIVQETRYHDTANVWRGFMKSDEFESGKTLKDSIHHFSRCFPIRIIFTPKVTAAICSDDIQCNSLPPSYSGQRSPVRAIQTQSKILGCIWGSERIQTQQSIHELWLGRFTYYVIIKQIDSHLCQWPASVKLPYQLKCVLLFAIQGTENYHVNM